MIATEESLARPGRVVHVVDREGDNYDLFSRMHVDSIRHVIRLAHNRNLIGTVDKNKDRALAAPTVLRRQVGLSAEEAPGTRQEGDSCGP